MAITEVVVAPPKSYEKLLADLSLAMVEQPHASLQDLAKRVGVSKATLYRFCRTREELINRLAIHAKERLIPPLEALTTSEADGRGALKDFTQCVLSERGVFAFLIYYWNDGSLSHDDYAAWEERLDGFFLREQRAGTFRIDLPAAALTEIFLGILSGMVDAERRGRVARAGLAAVIDAAFVEGTMPLGPLTSTATEQRPLPAPPSVEAPEAS